MRQVISFDTETTGLHPFQGDHMFSFSTGTPEGKVTVARLDGPRKRQSSSNKLLKKIWSDTRLGKVMHNCLTGSAPVRLADGTTMPIKDIVNNRLPVEVLSYNFKTGKVEPKVVTNWFKGKSTEFIKYKNYVNQEYESDEWVKFSFEHKSSSQVCLYTTPDHELFMGDGSKVEAKSIKVGDKVLLHEPCLDGVFRDFVIGTLLGDGSFHFQKGSRNCGVTFGHSDKQKEYFDYKCNILSDFISKTCVVNNNRGFSTRSGAKLHRAYLRYSFQLGKLKAILGGKKETPSDILRKAGPAALAIWYMDDGGALKGKNGNVLGAQICCYSFPEEEQHRITSTILERFGVQFKVFRLKRKEKISYALKIRKRGGAYKFFNLIASFIPPSMQYKLPEEFRGKFNMLHNCNARSVSPVMVAGKKVVVDLPPSYKKTRYDIEVKGNHNFFASNILVSNCKFDLIMTENHLDRRLDDHLIHDTMIMSHILQNQHPSHALKQLAWELAGYPKDDETAVKKHVRGKKTFQDVPEKIMDVYQRGDADRTTLLHLFFYPKIKASKKFSAVYKVEMDLIRPTLRMEQRGIMLHQGRCNELISDLHKEVQKTKKNLERSVGREVNLNKPADVQWIVYKKLGLPVMHRTDKIKAPSTKKEHLVELQKLHPNRVFDLIMKCKSFERGITTLSSYLDFCDDNGIIHSKLKTCGAVTGRESSSEPNLQNVTKTEVLLNPYPIPARRVFRPKPGYVNFHLDYSGIEIRLAAHYSKDPKLIGIINRGEDPHVLAAEIFLGNKYRNASPARKKVLRAAVKNGHFAIIYGAGPPNFSATLGLDVDTGKRRITEYGRVFPGVQNFASRTRSSAQSKGYIETVFGRRLHLPRDKAYMGTNYLIQGTAGEVFKAGQIAVHDYLEATTGGEVGMILPIHDELIIEFPRKRLADRDEIIRGVCEKMVDFPVLKVPLEIDVNISTSSWEKLKKVEL